MEGSGSSAELSDIRELSIRSVDGEPLDSPTAFPPYQAFSILIPDHCWARIVALLERELERLRNSAKEQMEVRGRVGRATITQHSRTVVAYRQLRKYRRLSVASEIYPSLANRILLSKERS